MMPQAQHVDFLFVDNEKYAGCFVATPSFSDRLIISSGSTFIETITSAREKGFESPVVLKIPKKGTKFLF